ncbi:MAG TPA: hypothetical protein VJR92_11000 [Gemmatimonadaceae bacterium]|nr:hypothetical protein [Gemmatimonadaceae bacterium]
MPAKKTPAAKQVVYLWGAGATQADVSYTGVAGVNLLMGNDPTLGEGVAARVLSQLSKKWKPESPTGTETDIEKFISLLAASNTSKHSQLADRLRKKYFEDIRDNLAKTSILTAPKLAMGLLLLHRRPSFATHEQLAGILTTNHDGLLQVAAQQVTSGVNIGMPFSATDLTADDATTPMIHLHGSFTWRFGLPLSVSPLTADSVYDPDTVWIPPTVIKDSKYYPFNKLAGRAYELLSRSCDVLRVVGSGLTQNDWHLVSMIFNAQRHREMTKRRAFRIELILPHPLGMGISSRSSYLKNVVPIGFLTEGQFDPYKDPNDPLRTPEMDNQLFYWLREKIQYHKQRGELGAEPLHQVLGEIIGEAA